MGYFSNGTEGAIYEEHFCKRCIHFGPEQGPGCPVWFAHLLYNYEECNSDSNAATILELLIPRSEGPGSLNGNAQCAMFALAEAGLE